MRMALSLYLDGQSSYNTFRDSSIQAMPSVSTLKKLKASMTPEEGTFPRCYGWFDDEYLSQSKNELDFHGHIMCDEMKLKSDFYWNPATHKCVGIVVSGEFEQRIDLADEVSKMFADSQSNDEGEKNAETDESSFSVSLSVNQFRFRSANNQTHTGEFFFAIARTSPRWAQGHFQFHALKYLAL